METMKEQAEEFLKSKGHDYGSLVGESDSSLISGGTIIGLMVDFAESQRVNVSDDTIRQFLIDNRVIRADRQLQFVDLIKKYNEYINQPHPTL